MGPLGFLTTLDDEIAGNMGMKDMVMGLHWVQVLMKANFQNVFGVQNMHFLIGKYSSVWWRSGQSDGFRGGNLQ